MMSDTYTIRIPMTFKRIGGRKTIVLPDGSEVGQLPRPPIDDPLVKAVARAYRWQKLIESRERETLAEIAEDEKISRQFVCQTYRLVLLAPEIVETIIDGRAPSHWTYRKLLEDIPVDWRQQVDRLGESAKPR